MTRTPEARRLANTARTAQVAGLPRITPTPAEHDLLRDLATVLRLTAKVSREIRANSPRAETAVAMN